MSGADGFAVHHVGSDLVAPTSVGEVMSVLRGIQSYHLNHPTENYSDIAYCVAVDQLGNGYVLRGIDKVGGATYGANDHTIACLWVGDSNVSVPTAAALQGIAGWYQEGLRVGALARGAAVGGHRDWTPDTSCPGDRLYAMLPLIRQLAGGATINPDDPLLPGPTTEDDELDANQAAQVKVAADVLSPPWPRLGRSVNLAEIAEMQFDNFTKLNAAMASQTAVNQQILATLQSIDARLHAGGPVGGGGGVTPDQFIDRVVARLAS